MIPEKIKIGCYDYDVKVTDEILIVDNRQCGGMIDLKRQIIKISDEHIQAKQVQEQTWWHEVVHGMVYDRNLDLGDNNELYTEELAKALYSLMKDNNSLLPGQS